LFPRLAAYDFYYGTTQTEGKAVIEDGDFWGRREPPQSAENIPNPSDAGRVVTTSK